jgi:autotransporter-associated beta strand protein
VIAGSGSFMLGSLSTSTLTLSGANTYSGGTTVESGLLQLNRGDALPQGGVLQGEMLQISQIGGSGSPTPGVLLNSFLMSAADMGYGSSSGPPAPAPTGMAAVPEPGTLLLLAAGAALAAWRRSRRKLEVMARGISSATLTLSQNDNYGKTRPL